MHIYLWLDFTADDVKFLLILTDIVVSKNHSSIAEFFF